MGSSAWSSDAYSTLRSSYTSKGTDEIFTSNKTRTISKDMSPKGLKFRESRDSETHPESLAVAINLDVTGSMRDIPEFMVRHKLGSLMETLIKHEVNGVHVMFNAIGDHTCDDAPLQVGQFEAGTEELNKCLTDAYLEGGGGIGNKESYLLAWLIAARHTSIDCFEKRGQKGILFTIGDERSWELAAASDLQKLMGYEQSDDITDKSILAEAERMYHVFHIHVNETGYRDNKEVLDYWKDMLGQKLIILNDKNQIAEVIASTVAMIHGVDLDKVVSSFDSKTASDVKTALMHIDSSVMRRSKDEGVLAL